jgi:hypothetical protein
MWIYAKIVQKIVNKGVDVNAKNEHGEMHLHLACGNNCDGVVLILFMVLDLLLTFVNSF